MATSADTCVLHTTYRLLRQANACKDRYTVFRLAATALGYKGDNTPVPLTVLLQTNGLDDTLWALRAVLPSEKALRNRLARLLACDYAEHVLPVFETRFPADPRPRAAIAVSRRYALGLATDDELRAARDAAWDAARHAAGTAARDAAWDAAWDAAEAARDAERFWQHERLLTMLKGTEASNE